MKPWGLEELVAVDLISGDCRLRRQSVSVAFQCLCQFGECYHWLPLHMWSADVIVLCVWTMNCCCRYVVFCVCVCVCVCVVFRLLPMFVNRKFVVFNVNWIELGFIYLFLEEANSISFSDWIRWIFNQIGQNASDRVFVSNLIQFKPDIFLIRSDILSKLVIFPCINKLSSSIMPRQSKSKRLLGPPINQLRGERQSYPMQPLG